MKGELTPLELAFIREYRLNKGNGTQAARVAGYKGNDAVLAVTANRLLKKAKVSAALAAEAAKDAEQYEIKKSELIAELKAIVTGSLGRIMDWGETDGVAFVRLKPKEDLTDDEIKFIDSLTFEQRFETEKYWDEEAQDEKERKLPIIKLKVGSLGKEKVAASRLLAELGGHLDAGANAGLESEKFLKEALQRLDEEEGPAPAGKRRRKAKS